MYLKLSVRSGGCTGGYVAPKLLRIMKLTSILLLAVSLQMAARSSGQTVTLTMNNVPVKQVLKEVQKQTGYNIIADEDAIQKAGLVSIRVKDVTVQEALRQCFKSNAYQVTIVGQTISIKYEPVLLPVEEAPDIAFIEITGKVTNEKGEPMAAASIINLTTKKGVQAASDGSFRIQASVNDIIQVSYVGYVSKVFRISEGLTNLQVQLQPVEIKGEELIVTGYQQIKKSLMTGSVSKVKATDLVINGTSTLEQSLQGKLAGVDVINNSGMLGIRQTVRVRGVSTLLGNQEPVWVVDGIIQEDPLPFQARELNRFNQEPSNSELLKNFIGSTISWLNPYDIEEVTVLKDAASTAIYGVKAANGVILITTKRGKSGRAPVVSYNASVSTQQRLTYHDMNLMNSKERVDVSREIWGRGLISTSSLDNVGYSGLLKQYLEQKISYADFNQGVKQLEVNNTDWFDILFQTPVSHAHNISVSGGGANNSYYGSFGVNSQNGQAKGNDQKSYQGSLNFTSNISSKLIFTASLAGNYSNTNGFYQVDPYKYATTTSRVIPAFNSDGTLAYYSNPLYRYNILNELANTGNNNVKTSLNANMSLRYRLPAGFYFESLFGFNYSNLHGETYATERSYSITGRRGYEYGAYGPNDQLYRMSQLPVGGVLTTMESRNNNYTWRNSINYGRTFNKVHVVTGLAGMELRSNIYNGATTTAYGYMPDRGKAISPPPAVIENSIGTLLANSIYSAGVSGTSIVDRTSNYVSYYGSGSYTYDNRYTANISVRADASNRFGQDERTRFKPIWALGGRWNVANEKFFRKTKWFNDFSIRATFGFQGNVAENYGPDLIAQIPPGASGISTLTGEPLLRISSLPYANLRWEKTQTIDLGLDFNFFGGRISASADYYNKRSKDLIIMKDVPFENGVVQMPANGGTLTNSGIDLSMNFTPVRTKDFNWSFGFNTSKNFSKITNKQLQNPTWNVAKSGTYYVEGYAISSFWVFDFTGVDSATGVPMFNMPTAAQDPNAKFDAIAFMKYAGKLNPDFNTGFNTSIRYKTLSVSTNLYLSLGAHKLLPPLYSLDMVRNIPNEYNNLSKDLVNRWRKPGDHLITNIPSLPQAGIGLLNIPSGNVTFGNQVQTASESPYTLYNFSTARVVNASYLRISNVNISYTLPEKISRKFFSKTTTVGYSISNLHTFVSKDYKGVDPEVASGSQPLPQIHAFTLSVSF
ncbi:MAG TPA: SusC/RagA family TonB-linked outer membrane protein [Chitinophagaceae bacterium]|nr:SusC/RagA family TonB-linked outer membrane protein [Chitinophagaceae bacterium]